MKFNAEFNDLSDAQRDSVHQLLCATFARVVTSIGESAGEHLYFVQLEAVFSDAVKVLNQRIRFTSYAADAPILGRRLFLHDVEFIRGEASPELGVYHQLPFFAAELWRMARVLQKPGSGPAQILRMSETVRRVMSIPDFHPYLPARLQALDLEVVERREQDPGCAGLGVGKKNLLDQQG